MKLQAEIGGKTLDVDFQRDGSRLRATVDDRSYDVEISEPESNVFLLKHKGRIYEAFVPVPSDASGDIDISIRDQSYTVRLIDPKRLRGSGADALGTDGPAEIRTAMPGKVVRILAEAGEEVEKGQGVIVVEAMKMQNELKSPRAGVVREVRVGVDSTVSAGDVLVTIE